MELVLEGKNLYIVNKVPTKLETLRLEDGQLIMSGNHKVVIADVYASLYCEELKNVTFIMKGRNSHTVTMIFGEEDLYTKVLQVLQNEYPDMGWSQQDKKINGYAAAIVAKLREGIDTGIVDKKEQEIKICPVCGMECDPNIPYCMECGAEV